MMRLRRWARVAAALVATTIGGFAPTVQANEASSQQVAGLQFRETTTAGAQADAPLPMIVVLHGRGGDRARLAATLEQLRLPARLVIPKGPVRLIDGRPAWFRVLASEAPKKLSDAIETAIFSLRNFVASMPNVRPTCGEPIVVGFSQGGMLAYAMGLDPDTPLLRVVAISAVVPNFTMPPNQPSRVPIVAMHGMLDGRVAFRHTKEQVATLSALGFEVAWRPYPGVSHWISPRMELELRQDIETTLAQLYTSGECVRAGVQTELATAGSSTERFHWWAPQPIRQAAVTPE